LGYADDSDEYWEVMTALGQKCNEATFEYSVALCHHNDPRRREIGANVLGQLWGRYKTDDPSVSTLEAVKLQEPLNQRSISTLLPLLQGESDSRVISSMIYALKLLKFDMDEVVQLAIRPFGRHPDANVRGAIASSLPAESDWAIRILIRLSRDEDTDVRDWATFTIAALCDRNTRPIRDALFARVTDPDVEIRSEAYFGLAQRGDKRAIEPLLRELTDNPPDHERPGSGFLTAVAEFGAPCFLPILRELERAWVITETDRELVEAAIEQCSQNVEE